LKFSELVMKRRTSIWAITKSAFVNRGSLALVAVIFLCTVPLFAQDTPVGPEGTQIATEQTPAAATNADALRKASQNPVASLISVPVQNNNNFGIGPFDRTQNVLNVQPVIPIRASENWNLIIRTIAPVIWQPAPGTANLEVFGIEENTPPYLAAQAVQKVQACSALGI
jgi:hypothetical protein